MRMKCWATGVGVLFCAIGTAESEDAKAPYPGMAPIAQYAMASQSEEIALARSAAPPSISGDAEIMILGSRGYETVVKGKNGFVCLVERSWGADLSDANFCDPNARSPICFNPIAARSVVPGYLERTRWILAGVSKSEMLARTKAALAANTFMMPEVGAMSYMMSKDGQLNGGVGHWHPHVMLWVAHIDGASWGADLPGSPVFSAAGDPQPITMFFIPVARWSDGTSAIMETH
jgi:hypothetical protein